VDARSAWEPKLEIIGHEDGHRPCRARPLPLIISVAVTVAVTVAVALVGVGVGVVGPVHLSPLDGALGMISGRALPATSDATSDSSDRGWLVDLPAGARAQVEADLAKVTPAAQPLIRRLTGRISFDGRVLSCRPPATSCSYPFSGVDGRWGIHLDAGTTASTSPSNRFLVYHEMGHAVWGLLLGPAGRQAFDRDVRRALDGQPCRNGFGEPCAALTEMFADEFARYAGGFAASMSCYSTPPLLDDAAFGALVGAAPAPRPSA
jgi:hypothetical protein